MKQRLKIHMYSYHHGINLHHFFWSATSTVKDVAEDSPVEGVDSPVEEVDSPVEWVHRLTARVS